MGGCEKTAEPECVTNTKTATEGELQEKSLPVRFVELECVSRTL